MRALVSDVEQLPIREQSMDSILCMDVIEHLRHMDRSIGEIARSTSNLENWTFSGPKTNPTEFFALCLNTFGDIS
jgi:2-polyprenyl-3-methyl-5-hydroxy-6-metoxy-1,4-benzoquinol methylase